MPIPTSPARGPSRRAWLQRLGAVAGSGAVYAALSALGLAQASPAQAGFRLGPAPARGRRVLVLGAGVAGLVSALELQRAGYEVEILEYQDRIGGRCWTLRGGDRYTELGGAPQHCQFDRGQYFNPGPWRIPFHHHGVLDYCRQLGVKLEPFVQLNHNAYVHSPRVAGGRPQRLREVQADFHGDVAELLAKLVRQQPLDDTLTTEDRERLVQALRQFGGLDREGRYRAGEAAADRRGFEPFPGMGISAQPPEADPQGLQALLRSGLWAQLDQGAGFEYQTPLFQPVGGMDRIAQALAQAVGMQHIRLRRRVSAIRQDARGVQVRVQDLARPGQPEQTLQADWCLCTLPLSVLSQLELQCSDALHQAIEAVPYFSAFKAGLQFRRRFWEEDEAIFGGMSSTELPIRLIGYPNHGLQGRKGVLLGAYAFGTQALEFTALPPAERLREVLRMDSLIHPQAATEFDSGMTVGWHRHPATLGCFGDWSRVARERHYPTLLKMDGRLILAGEHASLLPAWQEGAVLSARHAVTQLHEKARAA